MRFGRALIVVASCGLIPIALAASAGHEDHESPQAPAAHPHPEAARLKNPVASDAASLAAGKQVYDRQCANCHGDTGKGDGLMGEELSPKPSDLTDAEWKYGSSDGDIFMIIRDGIKYSGMRAYGRKLTAHQTWDVVNYVRSLGPHNPPGEGPRTRH